MDACMYVCMHIDIPPWTRPAGPCTAGTPQGSPRRRTGVRGSRSRRGSEPGRRASSARGFCSASTQAPGRWCPGRRGAARSWSAADPCSAQGERGVAWREVLPMARGTRKRLPQAMASTGPKASPTAVRATGPRLTRPPACSWGSWRGSPSSGWPSPRGSHRGGLSRAPERYLASRCWQSPAARTATSRRRQRARAASRTVAHWAGPRCSGCCSSRPRLRQCLLLPLAGGSCVRKLSYLRIYNTVGTIVGTVSNPSYQ